MTFFQVPIVMLLFNLTSSKVSWTVSGDQLCGEWKWREGYWVRPSLLMVSPTSSAMDRKLMQLQTKSELRS